MSFKCKRSIDTFHNLLAVPLLQANFSRFVLNCIYTPTSLAARAREVFRERLADYRQTSIALMRACLKCAFGISTTISPRKPIRAEHLIRIPNSILSPQRAEIEETCVSIVQFASSCQGPAAENGWVINKSCFPRRDSDSDKFFVHYQFVLLFW